MFTNDHDKPMTGRMCVVTGANSGIGKATALGLARLGATVLMVCRDRQRGDEAVADVKRESGNDAVLLYQADLGSLTSIRSLARELAQAPSGLHVLINNAGTSPRTRQMTVDGVEMQFAVNHLAPFLLTNLLLDTLRANAPARVVTVASKMHRWGKLDFDDIQGVRRYSMYKAYNQAKLANVMFTYELSRRIQGTGVTANCLHPGVVPTKLLGAQMGWLRALTFLFDTPEKAARTSIFLAASRDVENVSGKYFRDQKEARSSRASHDCDAAGRLWDISAELTGLGGRAGEPA